MGMKLKSGADLCGFELSRFCIQNDVAIPDAPASGRKYFHTGTGTEGKYSLLGRERIFTGTSWRAAAYVDDLANLDLATNADYLALKEKVNLLSGEVDTDAIINNMKEVTAFLSGFAEDANLMSVLNNKLDKSNDAYYGLDFNSTGENGMTRMVLRNNGNVLVGIGHTGSVAYFSNYLTSADIQIGDTITVKERASNNRYDIIHSGNIGEYNNSVLGLGRINSANLSGKEHHLRWFLASDAMTEGKPLSGSQVLHMPWDTDDFNAQLAIGHDSAINLFVQVRRQWYGTWSDWKTIAFTDSNVASAQALKHSNGTVGAEVSAGGLIVVPKGIVLDNNIKLSGKNTSGSICNLLEYASDNSVYFGYGASSVPMRIFGMPIEFHIGTTTRMLINSSGNVTIGATDKASSHKLWVDGDTNVNGTLDVNGNISLGNGSTSQIYFRRGGYNRFIATVGGGFFAWRVNGEDNDVMTLTAGGRLGLGLLTPSAQLHVNEDIVANGTIACKGVAAEGSAPVGTVDKWAGSIASGTKSQTYTHGLGTTDITVAIYEKNGNEWVQILTDVDIVNANTIRVTFGANTTVEHRIIVMG